MNNHPANKYEIYKIPEDCIINKTEPPKPLTYYMTVKTAIMYLRMCYADSENDEGELTMPSNWGTENRELLEQFVQIEKLQVEHRMDLGLAREDANQNQN